MNATSQTLVCPSCGASSSPDPEFSFINCEYCGASISVAAFYKDLSENSLESLANVGLSDDEQKQVARLIKNAESYLETGDFEDAKSQYKEILKIYPQHISSRLNISRCHLLDRSVKTLDRCEFAFKYVQSVKNSEKDPEITKIIQSISYDMASLGKETVSGLETIKIFEMSKNCNCESTERDELIDGYLKIKTKNFIEKIEKDLIKGKAKYSPKSTDLDYLISLSKFNLSAKAFCLSIKRYLEDNEKSMHKRSLEKITDLTKASADYKGEFNHYKSSGIFGKIKISVEKN